MAEWLVYPTRTFDEHDRSLTGGAGDPWMEMRVRDLEGELSRTRAELETLRRTTAELMTAVLSQLHGTARPSVSPTPAPIAGMAPEIQGLAELSDLRDDEVYADPVSDELEVIDLTNRESMAVLNKRFRWVPGGKPRSQTPNT